MEIEKYFQNRLDNLSSREISDDEKKMVELGQIEYFISRRLLSKRFRKNFLKDDTKKLIQEKVSMSVKENKPIYLIFAFGGYKNHWIEEFHPRVEWAEFFHLMYICELLAPIAKVYKPGIFLEYESEGEASIYHNNQSKEDIDAYTDSFKALVKFVEPYLPKNFQINYITLPEQYDTEAFFKKVAGLVPEKTEELRSSLKGDLAKELKRPLFNLKIKGIEDLSEKSKDELLEIALESLAFNHVFLDEDYKVREGYFNGDERISMVGAYCSEEENPDNWITINSCARSDNAFWTSRGVLVGKEGGYSEEILGPKAYSGVKSHISLEKVNLFKSDLKYLNKIPVLGKK